MTWDHRIRGPYYTPIGKRYLFDILETMGACIDSPKFADGSFSLFPRWTLTEMIDLCHQHDVMVSTGGFLERILAHQDALVVDQYIQECKDFGFDIVEISTGFLTIPRDGSLRLVEKV